MKYFIIFLIILPLFSCTKDEIDGKIVLTLKDTNGIDETLGYPFINEPFLNNLKTDAQILIDVLSTDETPQRFKIDLSTLDICDPNSAETLCINFIEENGEKKGIEIFFNISVSTGYNRVILVSIIKNGEYIFGNGFKTDIESDFIKELELHPISNYQGKLFRYSNSDNENLTDPLNPNIKVYSALQEKDEENEEEYWYSMVYEPDIDNYNNYNFSFLYNIANEDNSVFNPHFFNIFFVISDGDYLGFSLPGKVTTFNSTTTTNSSYVESESYCLGSMDYCDLDIIPDQYQALCETCKTTCIFNHQLNFKYGSTEYQPELIDKCFHSQIGDLMSGGYVSQNLYLYKKDDIYTFEKALISGIKVPRFVKKSEIFENISIDYLDNHVMGTIFLSGFNLYIPFIKDETWSSIENSGQHIYSAWTIGYSDIWTNRSLNGDLLIYYRDKDTKENTHIVKYSGDFTLYPINKSYDPYKDEILGSVFGMVLQTRYPFFEILNYSRENLSSSLSNYENGEEEYIGEDTTYAIKENVEAYKIFIIPSYIDSYDFNSSGFPTINGENIDSNSRYLVFDIENN